MKVVLVYVLVCLVAGVHAQLGVTQCTFASQQNCPNFLINSYCDLDNGVCECPTVAGYVDDGSGIACAYDCGNLTAPENGVVNASAGTTTGDIAHIECNNGYQMNGSSISTCVADAGWNYTDTICVFAFCDTLVAPENGAVDTSAGMTAGDIALIECNDGYQIRGSSLSTCIEDAGWDNTDTICEPEIATTTQTSFIETRMFIGLIAGACSGFFAFIFVFVYYVLSKHCCLERKKLHY